MKHGFIKLVALYYFLAFGQVNSFAQEQGKNQILWTANWSSDGKLIAIGGDDKNIKIYDGSTFKLLKVHKNESEVKRVRWHPTRNILAVAAMDTGSKIIDLENDKIINFKGGDNIGGRAIAWNHNGDLVAIADHEGKLTIWTGGGEHLRTIRQPQATKSYVAVDWHPYKNEIIVLGEDVLLYHHKGDLLQNFRHRNENVLMLCVAWHRSGKFYVIGDYGDTMVPYRPLLQFWKADGTLIRQLDMGKTEFRNISWNKKGNRMATASDALRIWSKKGKLLATGFSEDNLWGIDWSPNGKYIVTSSQHGNIIIWDKNARIVQKLN